MGRNLFISPSFPLGWLEEEILDCLLTGFQLHKSSENSAVLLKGGHTATILACPTQ